MGIRGLTTFIRERVHLEQLELHDTYLVIDGNAIASRLYLDYAKCNCCFGGDYDKYSRCAEQFFDSLEMCNITSLVLIDGGYEDQKIQTAQQRAKNKISIAYDYNATRLNHMKFLPLFLTEVFKEVMRKKNVQFIQTLFEADGIIASVARALNCPVLSYDSDFYIYDVIYIPFDTFPPFQLSKQNGIFLKQCKVYKVETLLNIFKGLDRSLLSLASILLGNDYIKRSTFRNFFSTLKLSKASKKKCNDQQRRIRATFNWLSNHTLNSAISRILNKIPESSRQETLELIEKIINLYRKVDTNILCALGFTPEFASDLRGKLKTEFFRFRGDINNLCLEEESAGDNNGSELSDFDGNEEEEELDIDISENSNIEELVPHWFIEEFKMGRYDAYFIDIITRRFYICPIQIEDHSCPPAILTSLRILKVITEMLIANCHQSKLKCLCRGKRREIVIHKFHQNFSTSSSTMTRLCELRNTEGYPNMKICKSILEKTLGIKECALDTFPDEWKLYIGNMIFWMNSLEECLEKRCYLYSLLFTLLSNLVDKETGCCRSEKKFEHNFGKERETILNDGKKQSSVDRRGFQNVNEALKNVKRGDCLLIAPFFLKHFNIDSKLIKNPKKYNVRIVHIFARFQICLRHTLHLNALLGYPYQQTKISELYNGTLLYNLYNNFKSRRNIDAYILQLFESSSSLWNLFYTLLNELNEHLPGFKVEGVEENMKDLKDFYERLIDGFTICKTKNGIGIGIDEKKRKREERKKSKKENIEENIVEKIEDCDFNDINNRFSILGSRI